MQFRVFPLWIVLTVVTLPAQTPCSWSGLGAGSAQPIACIEAVYDNLLFYDEHRYNDDLLFSDVNKSTG